MAFADLPHVISEVCRWQPNRNIKRTSCPFLLALLMSPPLKDLLIIHDVLQECGNGGSDAEAWMAVEGEIWCFLVLAFFKYFWMHNVCIRALIMCSATGLRHCGMPYHNHHNHYHHHNNDNKYKYKRGDDPDRRSVHISCHSAYIWSKSQSPHQPHSPAVSNSSWMRQEIRSRFFFKLSMLRKSMLRKSMLRNLQTTDYLFAASPVRCRVAGSGILAVVQYCWQTFNSSSPPPWSSKMGGDHRKCNLHFLGEGWTLENVSYIFLGP